MANTVNKTQTSEVLKWMKQHKYITSEKAIEKFGATRLSSIVFNLRNRGVIIETVMVDGTTRYGTPVRYARYYYKGVETD